MDRHSDPSPFRLVLVALDRHLTAAERERIRARADLPPDHARVGQDLYGIAVRLARVLQVAVNQVNDERVVAPRFDRRARQRIDLLDITVTAEGCFPRIAVEGQSAALPGLKPYQREISSIGIVTSY